MLAQRCHKEVGQIGRRERSAKKMIIHHFSYLLIVIACNIIIFMMVVVFNIAIIFTWPWMCRQKKTSGMERVKTKIFFENLRVIWVLCCGRTGLMAINQFAHISIYRSDVIEMKSGLFLQISLSVFSKILLYIFFDITICKISVKILLKRTIYWQSMSIFRQKQAPPMMSPTSVRLLQS